MKKQLILPWLLLLSSSVVVACQGGVQAVRIRRRLPNELLHEKVQSVHGLYTLANLMRTSHAVKGFARKKYTKGKEYYDLVRDYVNRFNHINTLEDWPNNRYAKRLHAAAEALANNKTITSINLVWNHIGDAGASALAEALEKNETITRIRLVNNNIGDAGVKALAEALAKNETIKKISLGYNNIGDKGAEALAKALEKNETIEEISLGDNEMISSAVKKRLVQETRLIFR